MDNVDINALKGMWLAHKREEDNAKALRLEVETAILTHFPSDKTEGSIVDADHGIKVTYKVTRTVDSAKVQNAWNSMSANAQKAFNVKFDLDTRQYKAIPIWTPQPSPPLRPSSPRSRPRQALRSRRKPWPSTSVQYPRPGASGHPRS